MNKKSYETAFRLIILDFKEILNYIEPVNSNFVTYSHRIYELFLRTCTEFESICKDMLIEKEYEKDISKCNIKDYKKLFNPKYFFKVSLLYWNPNSLIIEPFKEWNIQDTLFWYQAYNSVKHNRNNNFAEANLRNLVYSIGALFTMLRINSCLYGSLDSEFSYEQQATITYYYDYLHAYFQSDEIKRGVN